MDKERFTALVLDSEQTLYRVSMSMLKNEKDCEDAVQSALLTAYQKLPSLRREEYFKTWLVRILINECNDLLRKRGKSAECVADVSDQAPPLTEGVELRLAIGRLPLKIRQVITLYYLNDFSVKEIKTILRIPEGTVKTRLKKGRELLAAELGG